MKELDKFSRDSEKERIESIIQKEQEKEFKYESSISPHKGHKVFAVHKDTMQVKEPQYKKIEILNIIDWIQRKPSAIKKEIVRENGYIYISALNAKSALKRYKQNKGHAIKVSLGEKLFQN